MKRQRLLVLLAALVVLAVVAAVVFAISSQDAEPDGVALAGMRMSDEELREMSRDTMGTADLANVPTATRADATLDLDGTVRDGVREFELSATPVRWQYREGQTVAAWGYEGQVPGPTLRAREGERVRVAFNNDLPMATTIHWHGVDVPWRQDGIPGVSQEAIEPGEHFTYEFTATPAGTRWYHTHGADHGSESSQLDMGLAGALVIEPRSPRRTDVDEVLVLDEWIVGARGYNAAMMLGHAGHGAESNVFTINGEALPDVDEVVVRRGDTVRLRFVNASSRSYHPMHLHGHQFRVTALDGNPVESPVTRNVVLLAPGETADVEFVANNPGVWLLHCHDLHHADAGMGMLVRYEGYEPIGDSHGSGGGTDERAAADEREGTGTREGPNAPEGHEQQEGHEH